MEHQLFHQTPQAWNDACCVIAERLGGNVELFVDMMNQKAKELELVNTHFVNPTGLHDDDHYTCALDLSTMASYLIQIGGEKLFSVTSLYDSYIRENSAQKFWLVNTNKLLKQYDGNDGLKTGYTKEAGYCIVSTAKRDGLRLIAVVLKEDLPKTRNEEVMKLLDYGFSLYQSQLLYSSGDKVDHIKINNSKEGDVDVIVHEDVSYIQDKNNESKVDIKKEYDKLVPPISSKESIGFLRIYLDGENIGSYSLYVESDVHSYSFIEKLYNYLEVLL